MNLTKIENSVYPNATDLHESMVDDLIQKMVEVEKIEIQARQSLVEDFGLDQSFKDPCPGALFLSNPFFQLGLYNCPNAGYIPSHGGRSRSMSHRGKVPLILELEIQLEGIEPYLPQSMDFQDPILCVLYGSRFSSCSFFYPLYLTHQSSTP